MGDLSANLSRSEFACRDECGLDAVDAELVTVLQDAVDHFSEEIEPVYIIITGGNRCAEVNGSTPGSAKNSQHMHCRAADFQIRRRSDRTLIAPKIVYKYLNEKYPGKYGIGLYNNRVHFDSRSGYAARW